MSSTKPEPIARKKRFAYLKIIIGIVIAIVGLCLLWALPLTRQIVIALLARPKEIPVPTLTAPNAIKPESVTKVHLQKQWGNGTFRTMAWSPDGHSFAVGTTSGVNLYDGRTFQFLRYIDLPLGPFHKLVFSPDGGLLAAATSRDLLVIDLANDHILQQWDFDEPIAEFAYLRDGTLVCVTTINNRQDNLSKWVNGSWQTVKILEDDYASSLAFVPDKQAYVVFSANSVRLVDPLSGAESNLPYKLPNNGTYRRVLTHDLLLTIDTTDSQQFSVYKDGHLLNSIPWHDGLGAYTASSDGSLFATIEGTFGKQEIALWDIPTLKAIHTISIPPDGNYRLAFSPAGDWLAFLDFRSTVRIFPVAENQADEVVIRDPFASIRDVAITPQGEIRAVSCPGTTLEVLQLSSANPIEQWHSDKLICGGLINGAGSFAIRSDYDSPTRIYRIGEDKPTALIRGHCCSNYSSDGNVGVSSDESHASSGDPYIVAIWQKNFHFYQEWKFYEANVYGICSAVSPSGQYVAAADGSHTYIWTYGVKSWQEYPKLKAHVTFSPDEKYLASTQEILNLETGQITATELLSEDGNYNYDSKPVFSPDGQILAAEINGVLAFWRVSDGNLLAKIDDPNGTQKKLVFSSDGTFLVGLGEGLVNVWGISETTP